jgi:hypothetical protein
MQCKIDKIVPSDANPELASGVIVNGETLPADIIIMGVGVAPATEFLKGTLDLDRSGGVVVDELLRINGLRDVFAIGDIAVYPQNGGESRRIEHWNVSELSFVYSSLSSTEFLKVAGNHGRAVGRTISGDPQPFMKIPVFWSARMFIDLIIDHS